MAKEWFAVVPPDRPPEVRFETTSTPKAAPTSELAQLRFEWREAAAELAQAKRDLAAICSNRQGPGGRSAYECLRPAAEGRRAAAQARLEELDRALAPRRVRMLTNARTQAGPIGAGDVVALSQDVAAYFIAQGYAVAVDAES